MAGLLGPNRATVDEVRDEGIAGLLLFGGHGVEVGGEAVFVRVEARAAFAGFGAGTGGTKSVAAVGRDLLVGLHG